MNVFRLWNTNPCNKIIQRWHSDMNSSSRQSPTISVSPRSSLMDCKVKICISGLEAGQPVTLHASVVGDANEIFESHAHYVANSEGMIDNSRDVSHGGSFTGCEQMGFLWSMTQAPGQRKGLRLAKKDVTKPYNIELNCFDGHLSPEEGFVNMLKDNSLQPIARSSLEKLYMADGVQRIPVRVGRVRGTLFLPPGKGPFPGVIDLFGTAGGLIEFKAALLASHGFAALSLAYFAHDDLPKYLPYCELEYFEEGVLLKAGPRPTARGPLCGPRPSGPPHGPRLGGPPHGPRPAARGPPISLNQMKKIQSRIFRSLLHRKSNVNSLNIEKENTSVLPTISAHLYNEHQL